MHHRSPREQTLSQSDTCRLRIHSRSQLSQASLHISLAYERCRDANVSRSRFTAASSFCFLKRAFLLKHFFQPPGNMCWLSRAFDTKSFALQTPSGHSVLRTTGAPLCSTCTNQPFPAPAPWNFFVTRSVTVSSGRIGRRRFAAGTPSDARRPSTVSVEPTYTSKRGGFGR